MLSSLEEIKDKVLKLEKKRIQPTQLRAIVLIVGTRALLMIVFNALSVNDGCNCTAINYCKYLVVTDFTSDPYGIAKELRAQAAARGFVELDGERISARTKIPAAVGQGGRGVSIGSRSHERLDEGKCCKNRGKIERYG
jgi:hypothetical protein